MCLKIRCDVFGKKKFGELNGAQMYMQEANTGNSNSSAFQFILSYCLCLTFYCTREKLDLKISSNYSPITEMDTDSSSGRPPVYCTSSKWI